MIGRRSFIVVAAACLNRGAGAAAPVRIGALIGGTQPADGQHYERGFRDGLKAAGLVDGRDFRLDVFYGAGDLQQMRSAAAKIAGESYDLCAVSTATATRELLALKPAKPVIFWGVSDPVANGFVGNAAQPGGNVTGFSLYPYEVGGKWIQLLKDVAPAITQVHVVMSAQNPNIVGWRAAMDPQAARLRVRLVWPDVRTTAHLQAALAAAAATPACGVVALADPFLSRPDHTRLIAAHALRQPVVTGLANGAEKGALVSY